MRAFSVLLVAFLFAAGSSAFCQAQTINVRPCPDEESPSRPTLNRSQPIEEKASNETVVDCADSGAPCTLINNPVRKGNEQPSNIRFEGLKAVPESEMLYFLRGKGVNLTKEALRSDLIAQVELTIRELFAKKGYLHTLVSSRIENTVKNQT